jgi:hypothetical protein
VWALSAFANVRRQDIPQPYEGIVLIDVDVGGGPRRIALDYFDFTHINEACANEVDLYFKMQYLRDGYGDGLPHVLPGGYVTSSMFLYRNWCRLRDVHDRATPRADTFGRFGLRFSADIRSKALRLLSEDPRLEFAGGTSQTKYSWYLREMARARTCLDLPGQGPFCYRLVEALAMGCCVIGPRHATRFPVELSPGENVVHCADDLHDLPDLCVHYSRSVEDRAQIGQAAAAYFDRYLHPARLVDSYLQKVREVSDAG